MSPIYKSVIHTGDFVAFWQQEEKLWVFSPGSLRQKDFYVEMEDWRSHRTSYAAEDLAKYEDVVNAAWHYCGQSLQFLDRDRATRSVIEPGVYYPRIWRGYRAEHNPFVTYDALNPRAIYGVAYTQSAIAMDSLLDYLGGIFKYVEPVDSNLQTFSHKIREVLILVCTEIESGWRAVLDEKPYAAASGEINIL